MNRFNVSVRKIGKKFGKGASKTAQRNQSAAFVGFGDEWDKLVSSSSPFPPYFTPHFTFPPSQFTLFLGSSRCQTWKIIRNDQSII